MKNKSAILLVVFLVLGMLIGGALVKFTALPCKDITLDNNSVADSGEKNLPDPGVSTVAGNIASNKPEDAVAYTTFSSPRADFTFEYPAAWEYDEKEANGIMSWRFYAKSADNHNGVPYLEIQSPVEDPGAVGFATGAPDLEKEEPLRPYHDAIYVFATNDPQTFVTYQWGGREKLENGSGYIYWEKGQYFVNSSSLLGHKYNYMRVYPIPKEGQEIGLHIAQSLEVK